MMLKKKFLLGILIMFMAEFSFGQKVAVKSNLLYDATSTINLGAEFKLGARSTFELPINYNPWTFSDNKKFKHILVQPELRFWTCESFTGHFFGVHAHYAYYNVGGVGPFTTIKNNRYEGWLAGAGFSYGFNWLLSNRWSLEATLGLGYAYMDYSRYECHRCGEKLGQGNKHYFGPTRVGISLIYFIK